MATPDPRPSDPLRRPAGVEGDGLDAYPTYRDGPTVPHQATTSKPTDVGLPRSRRSYKTPILIGLLLFALVIIIRTVWGGMNMAETTDEAMTPGDPAAPAAAGAAAGGGAPATGAAPAADTPQAPMNPAAEEPGSLDRDVEAQTETGPGAVEATPGGIDVPGGETTTPVTPAGESANDAPADPQQPVMPAERPQ